MTARNRIPFHTPNAREHMFDQQPYGKIFVAELGHRNRLTAVHRHRESRTDLPNPLHERNDRNGLDRVKVDHRTPRSWITTRLKHNLAWREQSPRLRGPLWFRRLSGLRRSPLNLAAPFCARLGTSRISRSPHVSTPTPSTLSLGLTTGPSQRTRSEPQQQMRHPT
jgi:hypothetical protein